MIQGNYDMFTNINNRLIPTVIDMTKLPSIPFLELLAHIQELHNLDEDTYDYIENIIDVLKSIPNNIFTDVTASISVKFAHILDLNGDVAEDVVSQLIKLISKQQELINTVDSVVYKGFYPNPREVLEQDIHFKFTTELKRLHPKPEVAARSIVDFFEKQTNPLLNLDYNRTALDNPDGWNPAMYRNYVESLVVDLDRLSHQLTYQGFMVAYNLELLHFDPVTLAFNRRARK